MHLAVQFYRSLILKLINIHVDNFIIKNKIFLEILPSLGEKKNTLILNEHSYDGRLHIPEAGNCFAHDDL